jgi:hypothetical protein
MRNVSERDMTHSKHDKNSRQPQSKDPFDPFSLAIGLFGPTVGLVSFVRGLLQDREVRSREDEARRSHIRRNFLEVDNGLNRLGECYRRLSTIFEEQGVFDISTPGEALITGDGAQVEEIDRIKSLIFETGQNLQQATDELYEYVGKEAQPLAQKYSQHLYEAFTQARLADTLRDFVRWIGTIIYGLSQFLRDLGHLYGFESTYGLAEAVSATVRWTMENSPEQLAEREAQAAEAHLRLEEDLRQEEEAEARRKAEEEAEARRKAEEEEAEARRKAKEDEGQSRGLGL